MHLRDPVVRCVHQWVGWLKCREKEELEVSWKVLTFLGHFSDISRTFLGHFSDLFAWHYWIISFQLATTNARLIRRSQIPDCWGRVLLNTLYCSTKFVQTQLNNCDSLMDFRLIFQDVAKRESKVLRRVGGLGFWIGFAGFGIWFELQRIVFELQLWGGNDE